MSLSADPGGDEAIPGLLRSLLPDLGLRLPADPGGVAGIELGADGGKEWGGVDSGVSPWAAAMRELRDVSKGVVRPEASRGGTTSCDCEEGTTSCDCLSLSSKYDAAVAPSPLGEKMSRSTNGEGLLSALPTFSGTA